MAFQATLLQYRSSKQKLNLFRQLIVSKIACENILVNTERKSDSGENCLIVPYSMFFRYV